MKKVFLLTTGGTIASKRDAASGHVTSSVGGAELRAVLHDPLEGIELAVEEFCNVGSFALDLPIAFDLVGRIREILEKPDCSGIVVAHGTDTMEESAYMADLLAGSDKPVVFTGAQHAFDEPDPDGPRNLTDSIRLAASGEARGLGALICFEQEFHAARDVTKSHASRVDTFVSYEHGKLGEIDGERIIVHRRPTLRRTFEAGGIVAEVELIKMAMGSDGRYLSFAVANGARAVVIEGFGRGNAPPAVTAAAAAAVAKGVPVIMTSRCQRGRVKPIYGGGGGKSLAEAGVIFAGDLSGVKARILAAVLLGLGADAGRIRAEFEYLGG